MSENRGPDRPGRALRAVLVSAALLLTALLLPSGAAQPPRDKGLPSPSVGHDKKPTGEGKKQEKGKKRGGVYTLQQLQILRK